MKKKETFASLQTFFDFPKYEASFTEYAIQDKISFRRKRVNEIHLCGYTNKEIAKKTGFSLSTVEKDLHEIREKSRSWYEDEAIKDYCRSLYDSIILCDNAIEDLQILYQEHNELNSKLQILSKISDYEERKIKLYEKTCSVQKFIKEKK